MSHRRLERATSRNARVARFARGRHLVAQNHQKGKGWAKRRRESRGLSGFGTNRIFVTTAFAILVYVDTVNTAADQHGGVGHGRVGVALGSFGDMIVAGCLGVVVFINLIF